MNAPHFGQGRPVNDAKRDILYLVPFLYFIGHEGIIESILDMILMVSFKATTIFW